MKTVKYIKIHFFKSIDRELAIGIGIALTSQFDYKTFALSTIEIRRECDLLKRNMHS